MKHSHFKRSPIALGVLAASLGGTAPLAIAQDSQGEESKRLEEIVVTGSRREESLQDSAYSISAMSGAELERAGASSFSDYFRNIPGLSITDRGPGRNSIIIRGVSVDAEEGQIPTTAVYIDEAPITAQFSNTDLRVFDVERVEVLRGPQGTLYGASSLGGAVRYITNKADPNEFSGNINGEYSSTRDGDPSHVVHGAVNIPLITDTLGVRLSGYTEEDGGFIDNFGAFNNFVANPGAGPTQKNIGGTETEGGRVNIRWHATDSITATLGYVFQDSQGGGQPDVETVLGTTVFDAAFEPIDFIPAPASAQTSIDDLAAFSVGDESLNDEVKLTTFNLEYVNDTLGTFGYNFSTLKHNFRRGANNNDNNPFIDQGLQRAFFEDFKRDNDIHELRWVSPDDQRFRWVVGAYQEDNTQDINIRELVDTEWLTLRSPSSPEILQVLTAAGFPANHVTFSNESFGTKQTAYYGEFTFDLTEKWQITAGIRKAEWEQGVNNILFLFADEFFDGGGLEGTAAADVPGIDAENYSFVLPASEAPPFAKNDTTTGKFSVAYQPTDETLIFALWSEGFRLVELGVNTIEEPRCLTGGSDAVPGLNGQNLAEQESDDLTNMEIGIKHEFMDGRVIANVGYYQIDWKNIQFEGELPNDCGGTLPNGDAEINGFEFEVTALVSDNMQVAFNGSFIDGTVTRVPELKRQDGTFIPIDVVDVLGANVGTKMAGTPETQLALTVDYTWPSLFRGFDGNLNANYQYTEAVTNNLNEKGLPGLRGSQLKGDDIKQLNLGFNLEKEGLQFEFFVRNVFDDVQSAFTTVNTRESRRTYNVIRPRTIGLGMSYQF